MTVVLAGDLLEEQVHPRDILEELSSSSAMRQSCTSVISSILPGEERSCEVQGEPNEGFLALGPGRLVGRTVGAEICSRAEEGRKPT